MSGFKRKPVVLRNIGVDMKDFDWEVYLLNYPELVAKGIRTKQDACHHYKSTGFWEQKSCQVPPSFQADRYMRLHSHLGLKSPREAYIHFMRVGTVLNRNEGLKRTTRAYRTLTASQPRRPIPSKNHSSNTATTSTARPHHKPPSVTIHPLPNPSFQRPRRHVPPVVVRPPQQPHLSTNYSVRSIHGKRNVRQAKPGELVLREPPSVYFARMGVLGPPKYLN